MDKELELVRSMKRRKLGRHNSSSSRGLFSEDIMTEIFLWLPLKSLNRFKRLSKRWYFLITDKDKSYFLRNYLSSSSSRRRRNRIVGRSDDEGIMAGFFSLKPLQYWKSSNEPVQFLPCTCTQFKKYSFLPHPQGGGGKSSSSTTTTTTTTTTEIVIINKINPFLSFEKSLDKFLSARLHEDEESYPSVDHARTIFVAASSNGFLVCTLYSGFSHINDYLVNPVTMEWLALPKLQHVEAVYLGFVCKGDYPSLDFVEYTIVRLSWLEEDGATLLFQLLSNTSTTTTTTTGDNNNNNNEWIEYRVLCESLPEFDLCGQHNTIIVSTTNNNQGGGGGGGGGGSRILVYFLVTVRLTGSTAIVVIDLNEGDDQSLQMFETPAPDRGGMTFDYGDDYGADYIREFDDGVIHYLRFCDSTDFEFWVLNTQSGEWYLKHRASLKTMMSKGYSVMNVIKWTNSRARYHIHAFHPKNPNLIFLTLYGKFACYNFETGVFKVVHEFDEQQNIKHDYSQFIYQWPCWPPLL